MTKIELIFSLLYANNNEPIKGITRFEKLLFYFLKRTKNESVLNSFEFEAYNYGPHTDDLRDLLYALRDKGLIEIKTQDTENLLEIDDIEPDQEELLPIEYDKCEIYQLTPKAIEIAKKVLNKVPDPDFLEKFKAKFNKMNLKQLIQLVYVEYPDMTINSKIKDTIFN